MSLSQAQAQTFQLQQELAQGRQQLQQLNWHKLEFQLMFSAGSDLPSASGRRRLQALAQFLKLKPELKLRLDGYADPRGSDEYNNVLAQYRAKHVAQFLQSQGIAPSRIHRFSHGARYAISGRPSSYAQERRVAIEVFKPEPEQLAAC